MRTETYDKVQAWLKKHDSATMTEAFAATKVAAGTYYNQAKKVKKPPLKRRIAEVMYDVQPLTAMVEHRAGPEVQPGMVALIGRPEDVGVLLATIAKGVAR